MFSTLKKCATVFFLTATLAVTAFAGSSAAISSVGCDRSDFLRLYVSSNMQFCHGYANAGYAEVNRDIVKISTGNNNIIYHDQNGDKVRMNKWVVRTFPNVGHVKVKAVEIL